MSQSKLNAGIVKFISEKTGLAEKTVRKNVYIWGSNYPTCTLNAVAYLYALSKGVRVLRKLSKEDRETLPNIEIQKQKTQIREKKIKKKKQDKIIITYESDNHFIKGHIKEVNKAYTKGCYTSVHILSRKIIENLIRDILVKRFPPNKKENKELYYDIAQNRFKDFSVILENLYNKRNSFEVDEINIVKRLYDKTKNFKKDANDTTHSWYYLIENQKEIDELNLQSIIELIKTLLN